MNTAFSTSKFSIVYNSLKLANNLLYLSPVYNLFHSRCNWFQFETVITFMSITSAQQLLQGDLFRILLIVQEYLSNQGNWVCKLQFYPTVCFLCYLLTFVVSTLISLISLVFLPSSYSYNYFSLVLYNVQWFLLFSKI